MNITAQIENYQNKGLTFQNVPSGQLECHSPSNIALVKYWGKIDAQIPCNPSISFTLNNALSKTKSAVSEAVSEEVKNLKEIGTMDDLFKMNSDPVPGFSLSYSSQMMDDLGN